MMSNMNINSIKRIKLKNVGMFRSYVARLFKNKNNFDEKKGDWFVGKSISQYKEYMYQVFLESRIQIEKANQLIFKYKGRNKIFDKGEDKEEKLLIEHDIECISSEIRDFCDQVNEILNQNKSFLVKCLKIYGFKNLDLLDEAADINNLINELTRKVDIIHEE